MPELKNITIDKLTGEQYELAEVIGIEAYRILVKCYGGCVVYVAQEKALTRPFRAALIRKEYNGKNIKKLSAKYNLSTTSIRNIIGRISRP
ncbi:MAG: Mor transcription activator family protein [Oscillospiraceae bacterium]|nr:Mor transcription activator family protein [Oscillospiraceae bacterium]